MATATVPRRRGLSVRAKREEREFLLFVSPWLIGFLVFILGPFLGAVFLGLTKYDGYNPPDWVGLSNYQALLKDRLFWTSFRVTATYALASVPLHIALGLAIAVLLNQRVRGLSVWRTIYFLPAVVSGVAVAMLWLWIFNPEFGLLNAALRLFGIAGPAWINSRTWALPALVIMSLWGVGSTMVIYLAGLQGIPTEFYEAAAIDGAGALQRFTRITLPLLSPVIFFMLVNGVIGAFQVFTQAFIMTGGGPGNATLFYVLYLYKMGFKELRFGYASALAWILFLVILVLTLLIFRSSRFWVYYESDLLTSEEGGKK
jgi:multiple sugar transport system permease protein